MPMRIILSRKGFDSSNGGKPSPILPNGTMLSMPIPSVEDADCYDELVYNGQSYSEILHQLNPKGNFHNCHIDPDIRDNNRINPIQEWKPAFGQIGAAQSVLANAGVQKGDLFLFFGWFRQTEEYKGVLRYARKKDRDFYQYADLQAVYGYLEVGNIIWDKENMKEYFWHPHSAYSGFGPGNNALYIPAERLSFNPELKGYGTFDFREDRVLTMKGKSRATWNPYPFLMPEHVYGNRHNSREEGLYYAGIWQELIIMDESEDLTNWIKQIFS